MKYIIDVPENTVWVDVTKSNIKNGLITFTSNIKPISELTPYAELDKEEIEDNVWNFAWKIIDMDLGEYAEIFDDKGCPSNYQEAKAQYEAWLKQKDEIRVGDEIVGIYSDGEKTPPLVVLKVEGNYYYGIYSKTGESVQGGLDYEKTGRHFPEVAELLEKMRGSE